MRSIPIVTSAAALTQQQIEEDRHWWFSSRTRAIHAVLRRHARAGGLRVLDVGCGAGNMMHHLAEYGRVTGIEIDPRPLKLALQRGYDAQLADATAGFPFPDARFDLVAAFDVIEHAQDDERILREAQRVLTPGGHLIITTPAFMLDRKSTRLNSSHSRASRMPSSA